MQFFKEILNGIKEYNTIENYIKEKLFPLAISGLNNIHSALLINSIVKNYGKKERPNLVLVPQEIDIVNLKKDLNTLGTIAKIFPIKDFNFFETVGDSKEYENERLGILNKILENKCQVVLASEHAALEYTIPPKALKSYSFNVQTNQNFNLENLSCNLINLGYERTAQVEGPGQFAIRGGIFDIFTPGEKLPARLEFWGETLDSINFFEVGNQRRGENVESLKILPNSEIILENKINLCKQIENLFKKADTKAKKRLEKDLEYLKNAPNCTNKDKFYSLVYQKPATLFDYFENTDFLFVIGIEKIFGNYENNAKIWQEDLKILLEDGILIPELSKFSADKNYLLKKLSSMHSIFLDLFSHKEYGIKVKKSSELFLKQIPVWHDSIETLAKDLKENKETFAKTLILAGTEKAAKNLALDLTKSGNLAVFVPQIKMPQQNQIIVSCGSFSCGFEIPQIGLQVFSMGHTFVHEKNIKKVKKNIKTINSLEDLNFGDYVVHHLHGIGIFCGIHSLQIQDIKKDYIKISYAKGDILYVPVTQLDLVDKYTGPGEETKIKLNKLGTQDFAKTKARVKAKLKDIAKDLIKLYSQRSQAKGYSFSQDSEWQKDFEAKFPFEETLDQIKCIEEIKQDMQNTIPMERLLCGDVGFGKTEVALRAAFKCVADCKQCAILVPTTILAWQHFNNILKRFEGFSLNIELLSRFRKPKEQKETLKRLKSGETDIVIGTHRLVQKDVQFRDLGLVIIDEEQRFGVAQKEKFKQIAKNVDVLTLSATPIPRTLNMAMSGLRDISLIEEAPQDRYPVQTYVLEHDETIIIEAIRRELRRGGQVYYIHNNVQNVPVIAQKLQNLIAEANVGYAHGQMAEQELSEIWQKVLENEINILVCTTIIETGIDVPNVNSLIIENADHMGLSQLHQLRGRVGRSNRRAYAYFTFKASKILTEISEKRLNAIREFTEFGSGFKIAMRDLELRGAGNILSGEQHGHLADVGYDMYIKMLNQAIKKEKGEKEEILNECLIDLQINAHIPEKYIENLNQRISIYRKISDISSQEEELDLVDELIDRFGEIPPSLMGLISISLIRKKLSKMGVYEVKQNQVALFLYAKKIDENFLSEILEKFKGRIFLKQTLKPHIYIKLIPNENILELLKKL